MKKAAAAIATLSLVGFLALPAQAQRLMVDDSLRGSTAGTRGGGAFQPDGWRVTGKDDFIYWHVPTLTAGAVEFSVRGLMSNDARPEGADKNELFHMYDWTYNNADTVYDGYRNGPYKHFIRKTNVLDPARMDSLELVWVIAPNYVEPDTSILSWNPAVTYRFREEWGPDGMGNTEIKTYRDGALIMTMSEPGPWNPGGHSIRIAASTRAPLYADFGAPLDAVYSDVKIWSMAGSDRDNPNGNGSVNDTVIDKCGCGSVGPVALGPWIALPLLALAALLLRRRA